jgi:hypothetical protein
VSAAVIHFICLQQKLCGTLLSLRSPAPIIVVLYWFFIMVSERLWAGSFEFFVYSRLVSYNLACRTCLLLLQWNDVIYSTINTTVFQLAKKTTHYVRLGRCRIRPGWTCEAAVGISTWGKLYNCVHTVMNHRFFVNFQKLFSGTFRSIVYLIKTTPSVWIRLVCGRYTAYPVRR